MFIWDFIDILQVARANTALSLANFNAAMAVPAALGLDPSAARSTLFSFWTTVPITPFDTLFSFVAAYLESNLVAMNVPIQRWCWTEPSIAVYGRRIVYGAINSRVGMLLPKKLQSAVLEGLFAAGRAQVSPVFLSGLNPIASARVSAMQRLLEEGHSLQLQFPAEDLGFRLLPPKVPLRSCCLIL